MSDDNISGFKSILEYGIDLKLESYEEECYYINRMCDYFNDETIFKAYLSGDRSFEVEEDETTPVMEILIIDSTLSILPYTEDIFEVFTLMLGFVAKYHEEIISEIRPKQEHKIETLDEFKNQDEEEDSDDYEWI